MKKKRFLAFEVVLNGKRLCVAGRPDASVLSTILSWSSRAQPTQLKKGTLLPDLYLHVGGLVDSKSGERSHPNWVAHPTLRVGDTVGVRVIGTHTADPAVKERLLTPAQARKQEYKRYVALKKRFGRSKTKRSPRAGKAKRAG